MENCNGFLSFSFFFVLGIIVFILSVYTVIFYRYICWKVFIVIRFSMSVMCLWFIVVWGIVRSIYGRGGKAYVNVNLVGIACENFLEVVECWLYLKVFNVIEIFIEMGID